LHKLDLAAERGSRLDSPAPALRALIEFRVRYMKKYLLGSQLDSPVLRAPLKLRLYDAKKYQPSGALGSIALL
jgi:hypothetical protein